MEFTNRFHVPLPLAEAWKLMLDVPRILPCLPGARLVEALGDKLYKGSVAVKLGPVKLSFDGQAELVRVDEQAHVAWLKGAGMDAKGRGGAQTEFSFTLEAAGSGTDVTVRTELQLTGSIAQYGRGSGMISEVATQLLRQFEQNLSRMLLDERLDASAAAASAALAPVATSRSAAAPSSTASAPVSSQEAQALLAQCQAVLAATQQTLADVRLMTQMARGPDKELNGFTLLWRALWASLSGRGGSDSSASKR
ncbi:MAG: SRPBCC family protein [Betaproteobacteria bacterium]